MTEIYDYMRLLWARVGVPYSPATGLPITAQTVSQMVDRVMALPEGTRAYLLAPVVRGRKGEYRKELAEWQKAGFTRVRIDGEIYPIEDAPALDKKFKHDIEVVVDRIAVREGIETRLADSFEQALKLAEGLAYVDLADGTVAELPPPPRSLGTSAGGEGRRRAQILPSPEEVAARRRSDGAGRRVGAMKGAGLPPNRIVFSEKFACPVSGFTIEEIEPRLFSFNAPQGACPACDGLGEKLLFDPQLVVPNEALTLKQGAVVPWAKSNPPSPYYMQVLGSLAKEFGFNLTTPWQDLPGEVQVVILHGTAGRPVALTFTDGRKSYTVSKAFEGVIGNLNRRMLQTESAWMREELGKYQTAQACETCDGKRLKPEALSVKIGGEDISTITRLSVAAAVGWFGEHRRTSSPPSSSRSPAPSSRKSTSGWASSTTSGSITSTSTAPAARCRAARASASASPARSAAGLSGVLYVLDEPSIGLHQRDNDRLLETLKRLRDLGNTVIVVEHDEDAIRHADHIVDLGPGAGVHGGEIVAQGTLADILACPDSLTGQYLTGARRIEVPSRPAQGQRPQARGPRRAGEQPAERHRRDPARHLLLHHRAVGLGQVEPHRRHALRRRRPHAQRRAGHRRAARQGHRARAVRQGRSRSTSRPIGRTPRSNPATYTGAFTQIRDWFAGLPESGARGYKPGRFSFNVKGGRCEKCQGDGLIKIEMHFLPDVYVTCEECHGKRYNRETLEVKFKGKSIADVLDMTIEDAEEFFKAVPPIRDKMHMLGEVGLGYVKVGQQATTLSGGEAQRVKLAKELSRRSTGQTLYILDEPTTGLHFEDVRKLLEVLQRLVDQGNTVVVIEHNLDVIKTADWVHRPRPRRRRARRRDRRRRARPNKSPPTRAASPGSTWRSCWRGRARRRSRTVPCLSPGIRGRAATCWRGSARQCTGVGLQRPILVGGGAEEFWSQSALTPATSIFARSGRRPGGGNGRSRVCPPSGAGQMLKGWVHPELKLGFEVVAEAPMDGNVDTAHMLVLVDTGRGGSLDSRHLGRRPDRGPHGPICLGHRADRLDQARKLLGASPRCRYGLS